MCSRRSRQLSETRLFRCLLSIRRRPKQSKLLNFLLLWRRDAWRVIEMICHWRVGFCRQTERSGWVTDSAGLVVWIAKWPVTPSWSLNWLAWTRCRCPIGWSWPRRGERHSSRRMHSTRNSSARALVDAARRLMSARSAAAETAAVDREPNFASLTAFCCLMPLSETTSTKVWMVYLYSCRTIDAPTLVFVYSGADSIGHGGHMPHTFTNGWAPGAPWVEKQQTKNGPNCTTVHHESAHQND